MKVWARVNGGDWNADPTANPATDTGYYHTTLYDGAPMFATNQIGSTNDIVTMNYGASAFAFGVPSGFTAGWPDGTGHATINPADEVGATISGGNLTIRQTVPHVYAAARSTSSNLPGGKFYFEGTLTHADSNVSGSSIGVLPGFFSLTTGGVRCFYGMPGGVFAGGSLLGSQGAAAWHDGDVISMAFVLEGAAVPLTGVSGAGHAGTVGVSVVNHPLMEMTGLYGTELSKSVGNNNMSLRWSDDGGNTWSSPLVQSMGDTGQTNISVIFQQLGYSRDRVFEISWAADGRTALSGVFVNAKKAES